MSITGAPAQPLYQIPPFPVRRFSVEEYHQMIQAGVLKVGDKFELLDGWITPKMVRNPPHDFRLTRALRALLTRLAPPAWVIRPQCAITLATSEPEPDLAVVAGPDDRYSAHHPGPADVALVIEVADSSLDHDRDVKGPLYAQAGIRVYWIINLVHHLVEVYPVPSASSYQQRQDYVLGDLIPLVLAGQTVDQVPVVELLG